MSWRLALLGTWVPMAVGAVAVAAARAPAAGVHKRVVENSDVYVLPPPEQLVNVSMGYRSALADVLWSYVMVAQGLRLLERRRFDSISDYIDAVNALEPTFRDPYLYADTLITFQAGKVTFQDCERVRLILERGVANLPNDPQVWLTYGSFLAYMAPTSDYFPDEHKASWREAGAQALARAAELGSEEVTAQALSGATILKKGGQRDAAIRFLRRVLAVTDDPETRQRAGQQLVQLVGERERDAYADRLEALERVAESDLPFLRRATRSLLGPPKSSWSCAGLGTALTITASPWCSGDWKSWAAAVDSQLGSSAPVVSPTNAGAGQPR
jgi:hypothetical protein